MPQSPPSHGASQVHTEAAEQTPLSEQSLSVVHPFAAAAVAAAAMIKVGKASLAIACGLRKGRRGLVVGIW